MAAVPAIFYNAGQVRSLLRYSEMPLSSRQICFANSRIYVHKPIAKDFVAAFQVAAQHFPTGDPFGGGVINGPLVDKLQFDKVMKYIEEGKTVAGQTAAGGDRLGDKGYFVKPTVFVDVDENSRIMKEEIFGPVVIINTFTDEDEVIAKATEYGLSAAVYTQNLYRCGPPLLRLQCYRASHGLTVPDRAHRVAAAIESGQVTINHGLQMDMSGLCLCLLGSLLGLITGLYPCKLHSEV
jgi:aldehyde dehydrogenase (NAD+)